MFSYILILSFFPILSLGQDGGLLGTITSIDTLGYFCDPTKCQLPACNCASASPPGGLHPSEVPQFIVFTADDAIQSYTLDSVNQFLAHRKNPNGCPIKMTYFTSLSYTNYTMVTDWYVAGNEIADHTMTHVGAPPAEEINGNLIALNALAGIPLSAIKGFRAPFLNYSVETLKLLYQSQFTYDSSAAASIAVTDPNTDAYWPYTLDYGMANNCLQEGQCRGEPKLPGFWEIPMYAFFDQQGGPHLMDPWLDVANGGTKANDQITLEYMQNTFITHYNSNRQPIGLYTHPIHLAANYPGVIAPKSTIDMINTFLDWAQEQPNVWIVSNEQLLDWVQHPVPVSQLDQVSALKCFTPQIDPSAKICNGIPQNEDGLLSHCAFSDFPFYTCYGCPSEQPNPANPNPAQQSLSGEGLRHRLPPDCSTAFWDPIAGNCICNSKSCTFTDKSRAIGPNGANLTSAGNDSLTPSQSPSYVPFNGAAPPSLLVSGIWPALIITVLGGMIRGQLTGLSSSH